MNPLRTLALLALVAAVPQTGRATNLDFNPGAALLSGTDSLQSTTLDMSAAAAASPNITSIFAAAPVPVGDSRLAYRAFSVNPEGVQLPEQVEEVEDPPEPTPEPAGLFLLGSGAFVTALSIRYRLFSL